MDHCLESLYYIKDERTPQITFYRLHSRSSAHFTPVPKADLKAIKVMESNSNLLYLTETVVMGHLQ